MDFVNALAVSAPVDNRNARSINSHQNQKVNKRERLQRFKLANSLLVKKNTNSLANVNKTSLRETRER